MESIVAVSWRQQLCNLMTRVTINVCLDHIRKAKRWKFAESIEEMDENSGGVERKLPVVETNPTEGLEREE